jgi:uroporphyrinogen-III synthase
VFGLNGLTGKRIALTASRKADEIGRLIEKNGGTVKIRPTQGTRFLKDEDVLADIQKLIQQQPDWVIFTTGMGADALYKVAEKYKLKDSFLHSLHHAKLAARGRKTLQCLTGLGLSPEITDEDGTVKGLIEKFDGHAFKETKVFLQLYGENAPDLVAWFDKHETELTKILPYQHVPPEKEIVSTLIKEIISGDVDAVAFTSSTQVRNLFDEITDDLEIFEKVIYALNNQVVAAAVGKVTTDALKNYGIERVLAPDNQRMGSMVVEMSQYFD